MAASILVVDDERNIVQLTRLYLTKEGFGSRSPTTAARRWRRRRAAIPTSSSWT
jgi:DNA-binding response OmpR family regulator